MNLQTRLFGVGFVLQTSRFSIQTPLVRVTLEFWSQNSEKPGFLRLRVPVRAGELKARLDLIRLALKNYVRDETFYDPEDPSTTGKSIKDLRPQLMFDIKCPRTIHDFSEYRYPDTTEQSKGEISTKRFESPMKKDDHGPEALGRFMAGLYHAPETI